MKDCTYGGHRWTSTPSELLRKCKDCKACQIYRFGQWMDVEKRVKLAKPTVEVETPELWKEAL